MCWTTGQETAAAAAKVTVAAPTVYSPAVTQRMTQAAQPASRTMLQTVLTSPLGDPNFGKSISRTILTGSLS